MFANHIIYSNYYTLRCVICVVLYQWCGPDSNWRSADYEPAALAAELPHHEYTSILAPALRVLLTVRLLMALHLA